ncbi:MAG: deoxyribodipyrimidine photo-lyase, partial [Glaciimonas sp.]|nr:deoxyribodipyrimidine photo-lyase [Glaciimonas sp.]
MSDTSLVWFRRDLRLFDHAALHKALKNSQRVIAVFIFDSTILQTLPRQDRRLAFIWHSLQQLKNSLREHGSDLLVRHGDPCYEIPCLAQQYRVGSVYANHDYEPEAISRDANVAQQLAAQGIRFHSYKDQVIFERDEILTQTQSMYSVFTPYKRAWLAKVDDFYLRSYPVLPYLDKLARLTEPELPSLSKLGFEDSNIDL